ncbi:trans-aconitate 2-methyltransferase [Escherichia coli]|nr:trans-aconitate 2-methyltransferase [Escherichia coli]
MTATGLRPWLQEILTEANSSIFLRATIRCWKSNILEENGRILLAFPSVYCCPPYGGNYHVSW